MSINWRASLVPAAAVIPAPRAYTIIAAVKTPVVCHWVAGLLGGRLGCSATTSCAGLNPRWYVPAPELPDGEIAPATSPLHWGPKQPCPESRPWGALTNLRSPSHRSPPSLRSWKTQCAQGVLLLAECPSMKSPSNDRAVDWSCTGLGTLSGQHVACSNHDWR